MYVSLWAMEAFIKQIETLRNERARIDQELCQLYAPILDVSYAKWLRERISDRDVYLMVALRVFSPKTLGGARMAWGKRLRDALCANMGVNKWYVSKQVKEVLALYRAHRPFHQKVNETTERILTEIENLKKI